MKKFISMTAFLLIAGVQPIVLGQDSEPRHILFTNASLWDGVSDQVVPKMNVLVVGNLVKKISAEPIQDLRPQTLMVKENPDLTIDGGGRVLMPGLIEMHTHLMFQFGVPDSRLFDHAAMGAAAYEGMQTYMSMGYTTLRDVGGNSLSISRALAEGRFKGPRVYSSGGPINGISGHSDIGLLTVDPYESVFQKRGDSNVATGVDEVTAAVRTILRQGGTHIKVMPGGGRCVQFRSARSDHDDGSGTQSCRRCRRGLRHLRLRARLYR